MNKIAKDKALMILSKLIEDGERIKAMHYSNPACAEWGNKVETVILNISGEKGLERYNQSCSRITVFNRYGDNESLCQKYHCEDVDLSIGFLKSLILEIENFWDDNNAAIAVNNDADIQAIIRIVDRFHFVAKQLRSRHTERETLDVQDEYDVQDLFHSLLRLYFDDIRAEEWTPSCAGSSSRIDFLIPELNLAIEIKMTRKGLANKEAGDQLAIDKDHYRSHPDVKHLICFVYDPEGRIKNPRGFEKDLRQEGPLRTDVYVRPK